MKRIKWFVTAVAIGTLFFGCKAKEQTAEAPPEQPKAEATAAPKAETAPAAAAQPEAAASAPAPAPHSGYDRALLRAALLKDKAPDTFKVKFTTTRGDFVVTVNRAWAPVGADRFYNLVKAGYYNDASFFRVIPGFVVQFGLGADPTVNKAWRDAKIKDDPVSQSNRPGFLTFATAGKNTRTTQLFINLGNNAQLDSMGFSPFGQVTSGMDVVQKIHSEYGESPDQGQITTQGKAYLDKNFPKLDSIKSATISTPTK